ncbi:DUF262 domain-containing protein [Vibrio crassostreae]|nr:DUF262 domain-containing protein [Vibrio crassostreae]CAK3598029.1 DUF262 domain-containing protein [Vibrio crassostreae]CAK3622776.1 DUF262 domain-containing protein [Vibrio crassostreae]CAK3632747.1 DUF262 domain-containing protein [Vibrio crassostreae]CAK3682343.1 DUF262 domain-containing protein [Vibrio crassostreae]
MSLSYNSEPRVVFITQLLNQLSDGSIKIPRFQRELVWDWEQQRDLLCSIYEGLPIGAILMWHTSLSDIKSYSSIGPFKLNTDVDSGYNIYLMDGLQRLSTLYCTLLFPIHTARTAQEAQNVEVFCDLSSSDIDSLFVQRKTVEKLKIDTTKGNYMPLNCALDTRSLLKFQRNIPEEYEEWIDKSEQIASAFKGYKVPVVPLESNQQDIVTKSFERINTRGTIMSETHMLNALSYSNDFDLLQQIDKLRDYYLSEFETWSDIDSDYILSITKLYVGFDIYNKNTETLAKKINIDTLKAVFIGLSKLITFSEKELGITEPSQFPYKIQLFALAFALNSKSNLSTEQLKSWYIITTYTGAFGATARNSSNAVEDLKQYMATGVFNWNLNFKPNVGAWSTNTHFRTARVKAWALALGKRIDLHKNSLISTQKSILSNKGKSIQRPLEIEKIKSIPNSLKSRAGFYFINSGNVRKKLSLSTIPSSEREMHFLPNYLIEFLHEGRFKEFCEERERLIYNWEIENIVKPAAQTLKFSSIYFE